MRIFKNRIGKTEGKYRAGATVGAVGASAPTGARHGGGKTMLLPTLKFVPGK